MKILPLIGVTFLSACTAPSDPFVIDTSVYYTMEYVPICATLNQNGQVFQKNLWQSLFDWKFYPCWHKSGQNHRRTVWVNANIKKDVSMYVL